MNRRNFLQSMLLGIVAPAFLPGAGRQWKRSDEGIWMPYKRAFVPDDPLDLNLSDLIHQCYLLKQKRIEAGTYGVIEWSSFDLNPDFQNPVIQSTMAQ